MSMTKEVRPGAAGIRPCRIQTAEGDLKALRIRLSGTRWPHNELVEDPSQRVQLDTIQHLAQAGRGFA